MHQEPMFLQTFRFYEILYFRQRFKFTPHTSKLRSDKVKNNSFMRICGSRPWQTHMDTNSTSGLIIRVALVFGIMIAVIGSGLNYLQTHGLSEEQLAEAKNRLGSTGILDHILRSNDTPSSSQTNGDEIIIPLTRKGRSMFVQVELNEFREATLLVDTGASEVALTPEVAFDLGLIDGDTPEAMYMTANGQISSYVTSLESIRLGEAIQYDVPVSISKNKALSGLGDGLLGMSFFEHYIVYVDSAKDELHLRLRDG